MMNMFSGGRRRNGSTSHRYPANDSVAFDCIPEVPGEESSGTRRNLTTASSSRPTLAWPFQSRSISQSFSSFRHHSSHASQSQSHTHSQSLSSNARRSGGWVNLRPASSVLGSDIIPDYVVNFIRGETPETLARRREMEGNPRQPEFRSRSRQEQSWAAEYAGPRSRSRSGSRILDLGAMAAGVAGGDGSRDSWLVRLVTGWRGGVTLNVLLAGVVLVAMAVCIALAATSGKMGWDDAVIAAGDCGRISSVDQAVQAIGNVLGIFFIVGASYVTQVLVSPTRDEVDAAHAKHRWLDIGVPSLRNMTAISVDRAILSAAIVSAAVASQVIYNTVVFHTQADGSDSCSLALNGPLLGAVGCLSLVFILACVITVARPPPTDQLVTLGDAIGSFLTTADRATEGSCLLTKDDVSTGRWAAGEVHSRYWFPEPHRWVRTPSTLRWVVYVVSWLLPAGMAAAMLAMAVIDGKGGDAATAAFTSLSRRPSLTYDLPLGVPRLGLGLVLALPQLLLVLLYFSTNSLLSVLYLSHEFSQFAGEAMPLRVSTCRPLGSQLTSLYLTLPRPVSWVLYILFVAMGFMLNQAFNLVSAGGDHSSSLGVNPLPLVILLGLLVLVLILLLAHSLRRGYCIVSEDGRAIGNPLNLRGGSCSAVISARCHRSPREGEDVAAYPLVWGGVGEDLAPAKEAKIGHATFSSLPVDPLKVGKAYA